MIDAAERERVAAENMDWDQVVLNGGPPCFHLYEQGFCGRAKRWAGHANGVAKANRDGCAHEFVSLAELLALCANEALERVRKVSAKWDALADAIDDGSGVTDCAITAARLRAMGQASR